MQQVIERLSFLDRSGWRSGEWDNEPDRIYWVDTATGYPCLIRRSPLGGWCGYVAIAKNHPFYGGKFDIDLLEVHGGVTYLDSCDGNTSEGVCHIPTDGQEDDAFWIGFDCCHAWDDAPYIDRLLPGTYYRNVQYVTNEVKSLAVQLKKKEDQ